MRRFKLFRKRFGQILVQIAFASVFAGGVGANTALAAENDIADTSTPTTMEQVTDGNELETTLQDTNDVSYVDAAGKPYIEEGAPVDEITIDMVPVEENEFTNEATSEESELADEAATQESEFADEVATQESELTDEAAAQESELADEAAAQESEFADEVAAQESELADEVAAQESELADEAAAQESEFADEVAAQESEFADETSANLDSVDLGTLDTPNNVEYTAYVTDGNVNVVGDVNPEDLQKLDDTVSNVYEGTSNDVYIENTTLEEGTNEIQTNGTDEGIVANVDSQANMTLEGDKVSEMTNLDGNFEVVEATNTNVESDLRENQYEVVKDANGNYILVFGGELPNAVDVVKITNELKANNPELADVAFTYEKASNVDMNDKEVVVKQSKTELGAKEYAVVQNQDGNYKIVIDSDYLTEENIDNIKNQIRELHPEIDVDNIQIVTSKDVNLDEVEILETGYARGDKPKPETPTPETPTPETPTPETPTPETPTPETPTPEKHVVPQNPTTNVSVLPKTGDNTLQTLNSKILIAGLAALAGGIVIKKKRETGEAVYGMIDKDTFDMISGKDLGIKGMSR